MLSGPPAFAEQILKHPRSSPCFMQACKHRQRDQEHVAVANLASEKRRSSASPSVNCKNKIETQASVANPDIKSDSDIILSSVNHLLRLRSTQKVEIKSQLELK